MHIEDEMMFTKRARHVCWFCQPTEPFQFEVGVQQREEANVLHELPFFSSSSRCVASRVALSTWLVQRSPFSRTRTFWTTNAGSTPPTATDLHFSQKPSRPEQCLQQCHARLGRPSAHNTDAWSDCKLACPSHHSLQSLHGSMQPRHSPICGMLLENLALQWSAHFPVSQASPKSQIGSSKQKGNAAEQLGSRVQSCERVVCRHGAILLNLRVRIGFSARRFRPHGGWSSGQRIGRSERKK